MTNKKTKLTSEEISYLSIAKIDPVAKAEALVGHTDPAGHRQSYKTFNDEQNRAMLSIAMSHNLQKVMALENMGDTTLSMDLDAYLYVVHALGFEVVYQKPILRYDHHGDSRGAEREETFFLYGHRELGLVLRFDSFSWKEGTPSVNGGNWYGVWKPTDRDTAYRGCLSSGSWEHESDKLWRKREWIEDDDERKAQEAIDRPHLVWRGSWDCREALKLNIKQCLAQGSFLKQWPTGLSRMPSGMLTSSYDYYNPEYEAVGKYSGEGTKLLIKWARERLAETPEWFRDIFNGLDF